MNGPVPIGCRLYLSPSSVTAFRETIQPWLNAVTLCRNSALGEVRTKRTVDASGASMDLVKSAICPLYALPVAGSMTRSNENLPSSEENSQKSLCHLPP